MKNTMIAVFIFLLAFPMTISCMLSSQGNTNISDHIRDEFEKFTRLREHKKQFPNIEEPLSIQVFLHSVHNRTNYDVVIDNTQPTIVVSAGQLLPMNVPFIISEKNTLFVDQPSNKGPAKESVRDKLNTVRFKYKVNQALNSKLISADLNPWINKSKLILGGQISLSHPSPIQAPCAYYPIGIDNAKNYYLSLILAGSQFEQSSISISHENMVGQS